MIDNKDEISFIKIETTGFQSICDRLAELEEENKSLKVDNDFLQRQNAALKLRCSKYALEIKDLQEEVADLKFTHKHLTEDKIEESLERQENHYYEMGTAIYGDDF